MSANDVDIGIRAIQQVMEALQNTVARLTYDGMKHRNTLVPVNSLPAEIMADIFRHSVEEHHRLEPDSPVTFKYAELRRLSLVCSRWHQIVLTSLFLWREITSYRTILPPFQRALSPSSTYPLTVHFDDPNDLEFVKLMEPLRHRWQTLHLRAKYEDTCISPRWVNIFNTVRGAPNLTHLVITFARAEQSQFLPFPESPALVYLDIANVSFDTSTVPAEELLPPLFVLKMAGFHSSNWQVVWKLIRCSPRLNTLCLEHQKSLGDGSLPPDVDLHIFRPELRYLKLWRIAERKCAPLLKWIVADGLERLHLKTKGSWTLLNAAMTSVPTDPHGDTCLRHFVQKMSSLSMLVEFDGEDMITESPIPSRSRKRDTGATFLCVESSYGRELPFWITDSKATHRAIHLEIEDSPSLWRSQHYVRVATALAEVVTVLEISPAAAIVSQEKYLKLLPDFSSLKTLVVRWPSYPREPLRAELSKAVQAREEYNGSWQLVEWS